ncbi:hypothetical protein GGS26DRAFT_306984 [Hypomontagnella submonticulosa]|nr:hypothetical protein GGS26DRAFT_306984 [Hypomontagnella submonticulosa]
MTYHSVPTTNEVIPGAFVNIVLKADQRTGREVSGTVRDVLTKGNHPRGIKVRLADGRIGRVQSIASSLSSASSSGPSNAALAGSPTPPTGETTDPLNRATPHAHGRRSRYRDARHEEPLEAAPEQADLSAYIVPAKRQGKKKKNQQGINEPDSSARGEDISNSHEINPNVDVVSATATCPVCGAFEGDETAVAHHVAGHFE